MILAVLTASLTIVSNGIAGAFSTTVGKLIGLFTLWCIICVPFSQWKGGSFNVLTDEIIRSFLVFVMVSTAINTVTRIQGLMAIMGSGIVVTMLIALIGNHRVDGRLTMSAGQYSNPNDLAQIMLLGMCFLPILGTWLNNSSLKWLTYLMMVPFLYTIFITGSRGALIGAVLLGCFAVAFASAGVRVLLIVLFPALVGGLLAASPTARLRLDSLIHSSQVTEMGTSEDKAISSTSERLRTLQQSIELTVKNPIFGVGPGVFQSAAADLQRADGQRASWIETHNAYTQVSSETGIPGAIFFCSAVLVSLRELFRIRKRTRKLPQLAKLQDTATLLLLGFVTFAVTSFFSSVAYGFIFWSLFGLCAASISTIRFELACATSPVPRAISLPKFDTPAPPVTPQPTTRVTLSGKMKPSRNHSPGVHNSFRG
ncbi:MAG: O-antigen ligase family protein [Acidobacteriota bacterium]